MTENKLKRTNLTLEDRCIILKRLEDGESAINLAKEFNVTRQAISLIKKRSKNIKNAETVLKSCDGDLKKKRYKGTEESDLDKKLFEWFKQRRSMGFGISGLMVKKQALLYSERLGKENFTASDGWLEKFKKRHGLKQRNIQGEKLSANFDGSEEFKMKMQNIINVTKIGLDFIYNCDETGLYWKAEPTKTLVCKNEKCADGRKKAKNRLTVLLCCNASGTHKLPLFVIGKSAQPRCLKNVKHIPVHYTHQENAWMTTNLMTEWYQSVFLPEIKKKHDLDNNKTTKIILLMDNAGCHPPADILNEMCDNCTILYLPPNVTSLIQPLDQGIIEKFKRLYKNYFSEKLLIEDGIQSGKDFLTSFNILDCFHFCKLAWDQVTSSDIRNCWKKLIPLEENNVNSEINWIDATDFHNLLSKITKYKELSIEDIENWLNVDAEEIGWQALSDDDILNGRFPDGTTDSVQELDDVISYDDQNYSPEDSIVETSCPTFIEAYQGINTFLRWYEKKGDSAKLQELCFQKAHEEMSAFFISKI